MCMSEIILTRVTFPLTKREGLGGMVTPIFNDLLNDHDGFKMMMKDMEGHERARGKPPGSRSGARKGIWRRTPGGGGLLPT